MRRTHSPHPPFLPGRMPYRIIECGQKARQSFSRARRHRDDQLRDALTQSLANLVVVSASARRMGSRNERPKPRLKKSGPAHRHFHPLLRPSAENNLSEKFVDVILRTTQFSRQGRLLASRFCTKVCPRRDIAVSDCASVSPVDLQILPQANPFSFNSRPMLMRRQFADTPFTFLGNMNKRDRPICGQ